MRRKKRIRNRGIGIGERKEVWAKGKDRRRGNKWRREEMREKDRERE